MLAGFGSFCCCWFRLDDSLLLFRAFYWRINGCFIHEMYYYHPSLLL
jgi:hypothetical protein